MVQTYFSKMDEIKKAIVTLSQEELIKLDDEIHKRLETLIDDGGCRNCIFRVAGDRRRHL
ncbi:MAG: hypothetical protein E3K37_16595 [Candidatus Kuenenia sp.]|nr:hypothetical protein [Candidatus Kuenenia hertensis]